MAYTGILSTWLDKIKNAISGLSVSGTTVTYTKNDGTTGTITTQDTVYSHPTTTARTGKPTANATPAFGDTFTVSQVKSNTLGHVTSMTDRTIKIPNTLATTSAAGLMSAADKTKLDGLSSSGGGDYLPLTGGEVTGNVTVTNTLTADLVECLNVKALNSWEKTQQLIPNGSTCTINFNLGGDVILAVSQNTSLTLTATPPDYDEDNPYSAVFTLGVMILNYSPNTSISITWPSNIKWVGGTGDGTVAPTLEENKVSYIAVLTTGVDHFMGFYLGSMDAGTFMDY